MQLMTLEELAKFLKVKRSWIYCQTRQKSIPFHKVGGHLRFDKVEIEIWLREGKTEAKDKK